ncbi:uncharacterized protein AAG666_000758 [Megaptera novaeangliae]
MRPGHPPNPLPPYRRAWRFRTSLKSLPGRGGATTSEETATATATATLGAGPSLQWAGLGAPTPRSHRPSSRLSHRKREAEFQAIVLPRVGSRAPCVCPRERVVAVASYQALHVVPHAKFMEKPSAACRILVPRPRIEPWPLAVRTLSPNHWSALEFPSKLVEHGKAEET